MDARPPPGDSNSSSAQPQPPDGSTLTQALEASYRNVWIRLMTAGVGQQYFDAITTFVVATMAAFKSGYSITALKFELAANEKNIQYMGRDVSLNDQEKKMRLIWISLVYITLAHYKFNSERSIPSFRDDAVTTSLDDIASGLISLVDSVVEAERDGHSFQTFKMEISKVKEVGEEDKISLDQANIRSQWTRIVFTTLGLLPNALKRK